MERPGRPDAEVLTAFGVAGAVPVPLSGGRGLTWRAGGVVFRPHGDPTEAAWKADVLTALRHSTEFRTPRPVATRDGAWLHRGWEASSWLDGATDASRVQDVIRAGAAFHRAVADLPRPAFLDTTDDPWSRADRMVWGETPLPPDRTLAELAAAFRPVETPAQVIHGDLLGNVLFAADAPPAVFDWAPYWRPAGLGAAIAAVDAVCWQGVPLEDLGPLGVDVPEWSQLLVRALAFRIATLVLLGAWDGAAVEHHRPVVAAVTAAR
ncbi:MULTISPECIES: hypothetical protein [unclassified Curtobacterium]|uniref:hypothetical protein n=1 Tax=unclassified Curtobacterium TaxID=257496 RepID=UPI00226B2E8F|nr:MULTISPECIES: hypothetical protein [unclassified Curtobacterium]